MKKELKDAGWHITSHVQSDASVYVATKGNQWYSRKTIKELYNTIIG